MTDPKKRTTRSLPARFQKRLAKALKASGLSKYALAKKLGGKWTQSKVETQLTGNAQKGPTLETVCALAIALDVSASWLLFGEGPMSQNQVSESVSLETALLDYLRPKIAERLDGETSRRVYAEDIDIDFHGLTDAIVASLSESVRAFAETVIERGKSYSRDARLIPNLLAFEVTSIQHSLGKAASDKWMESSRDHIERERLRLRQLYEIGLPEGPEAIASLSRSAVNRLEEQPPSKFVGLVGLGMGRIPRRDHESER